MSLEELKEFAEEVKEDDDVVEWESVFMDGMQCVSVRFEDDDELERWRDDLDLSFNSGVFREDGEPVLYVCINEEVAEE